MKKFLCVIMAVILICTYCLFAIASGSSDGQSDDQGKGQVDTKEVDNSNLGGYLIEIQSCRIAKDFQDNPVVIVKYSFTNNDDDATSFMIAFTDNVYQNNVGLNKAYVLDESANYSSDNQTKEIKKGGTIDVEVAYELNDTTTDIEVEVEELFSFSDKVVKKTFKITE